MTMTSSMQTYLKRMKSTALHDPIRDWFVLITFFGIILIAVVAWNIWAFDTVASGGTLGESTSGGAAPLDSSSLSTIHNIFQDRATEAAKYVTGVYRYADPSQ